MQEGERDKNFISQIINDDVAKGFDPARLRFRFPPEPNGFLHIGHAAAICLNFELGEKFNAPVNLRFDDTNPTKEETKYINAIKEDIKWLGFHWDKECFASDYFQQLYQWAITLIKLGKAYVDSQQSALIAQQKGTPTLAGTESPYRNRSIEENDMLFQQMKDGGIAPGGAVLRAKIDMKHTNMHMRDPIMYRIIDTPHHRTGSTWRIYPMYDWTHGQSDYIEQISHSFCTLEFKPHRELYQWYLEQVRHNEDILPKQREFARRNLSYTVTSKRKLAQLVQEKIVTGWDDPRMPTIAGLRRRGYTPESIKKFSKIAGITKRDNVTDVSLLEHCIKEDLNTKAKRVMVVLDPLKIVITNYPENEEEWLTGNYYPDDTDTKARTRQIPFSKTILIEREDFREVANKKFFRLKIGSEVRLKNGYIIKANEVEKDDNGNISAVYCTYDPNSKSGSSTEQSLRKVKGTLHWVAAAYAQKITVRLYDRLFTNEVPDADVEIDFKNHLNKNSLEEKTAWAEPAITSVAQIDVPIQFQRKGYFCLDDDSQDKHLIFNKTVGLTDSWKKQDQQQNNTQPITRHPSFDKVGRLAGSYLKAKNSTEQSNIITAVTALKKSIPEALLWNEMNKATSNKEVLRLLLLLPMSDNPKEDRIIGLLEKALKMKNSTILQTALDYIKNHHLKQPLQEMLTQLKNTCNNDFILRKIP